MRTAVSLIDRLSTRVTIDLPWLESLLGRLDQACAYDPDPD